ncbi:hypothetical protein AAFN60_18125 [Roseibacillus persicicus]|uniref:hypothetical protein n=1 Tax=Roseibacillus persicicus TaxID=454148 RepID=UPI00398A5A61
MNFLKSFHVLSLLTALMSSLNAAVGIAHIHEFGTNTFAIDQEFMDTVGFGGGPGGRDYTGITFSSTPVTTISSAASIATLGTFGVSGLPATHQFDYTGPFLDESVTAFVVNPGDEFSRPNILGGDFVELEAFQTYYLPQVFFLGVLTPAQQPGGAISPVPPYNPAFGWLRIQNSNGVLSLLDHAIAYESEGIVVGTTITIPEPRFGIFLFIVIAGALSNRRRLTIRSTQT